MSDRYKTVTLDAEDYERLCMIAEKLGMTRRGLLKLLINSVGVEEEEDEIILVMSRIPWGRHRKVYKILTVSEYRELLKKLEYSSFVVALAEHGWLTLAKKYLRGESNKILEYLNDDAIAALEMHREEILRCSLRDARTRKPLCWIL